MQDKLTDKKSVSRLSLYIVGGIALTVYLAFTAFLIWGYFDLRTDLSSENSGVGIALVLALIVIFYGIIVYVADTILWMVGLIISIVKRKKGLPFWWIITFAVACVVPAITEAIMILAYSALGS